MKTGRTGNQSQYTCITIYLNKSLQVIGKHAAQLYDKCNFPEIVQHVFMECDAYETEKKRFQNERDKINIKFTIDDTFHSDVSKVKGQIRLF